jgi:signal transduction histidine kinase
VRLRRRLNTVLLQWFLLLVLIVGAVWLVALPRVRQGVVDDRLLLARSVAHALDSSISSAIQDLDRLAADLPATDDPTPQLHAFRLQSPFAAATYVLDAEGRVTWSDPPGVAPISMQALGGHETVTRVERKAGDAPPVVAIVQTLVTAGRTRHVVSEMRVDNAPFSVFLKELDAAPSIHVAVVDDAGTVVAAAHPEHVHRVIPEGTALGERIRAHRPDIADGVPGVFDTGGPTVLRVMAPLRFAPWGVVIEQPAREAFTGPATISRGFLIAALLLTLVGGLVTRTMSRSIVRPIQHLSRQAESMRRGDLSSRISVRGDHEIEVLASTLDDARSRLASTLAELQAFNDRLEEQVASRTEEIARQNEQRKVLVRKMLSATEDERRRFARELHDEIAQLLTVIQLSLHDVPTESPQVQRARELLVRTQAEIHRIIHDLRPSLLDDLGLAAAMRSYADDHLRGSGLACSVEIEEGLSAHPEVETVIFRIFQELVTNIVRHAEAEQLSIQLYRTDTTIVLEVEDDGKGFDADARTNRAGVLGMRERAALVNGTIRFDSEPGAGTHVVLEIPLS